MLPAMAKRQRFLPAHLSRYTTGTCQKESFPRCRYTVSRLCVDMVSEPVSTIFPGKPSPVSTMTHKPVILWQMLTLAHRHRRSHEVCAVGLLALTSFSCHMSLYLSPSPRLKASLAPPGYSSKHRPCHHKNSQSESMSRCPLRCLLPPLPHGIEQTFKIAPAEHVRWKDT